MKKRTIAMLLAGGQGSRLNILSQKRAKPAVPFGGIYRIIDFVMSNLMHSDITNVGILTQYKPASLMNHISVGEAWDMFGRTRDARILPPHTGEEASDWYRGTADAIYQNINYIEHYAPEEVLIVSGDHIYKMDYIEMLEFHRSKKSALTIACKQVPLELANQFGIMETDKSERIIGFEEKPKEPKNNLASLGIYIFDTEILLKELKADALKKTAHDFGKNIIPSMIKDYNVYAYTFNGYWQDVGTIEAYWQTNMDILDHTSGLDLKEWKVRTNLISEQNLIDRPPVRLEESAHISNSIISPGCIIAGRVEDSIIGPGVVIDSGAVIHNSILMHNLIIGKDTTIDNCIIDKDVQIGENCYIGCGSATIPNKKYPTHLNNGITLIGKGAVIPNNIKIGRNVIIFPNFPAKKYKTDEIATGETLC